MNINAQLQELTAEALGFIEVIGFTENPDDADFCNACNLFSQYLYNQLEQLKQNIIPVASNEQLNLLADQLYQLSNLITPEQVSSDNTNPWSSKLHDYCLQAETLRNIAA